MSTLTDCTDRCAHILKFLNSNKHTIDAGITRLLQWSGTKDNKRHCGSENVKESLYLQMLHVCDVCYKHVYKVCVKTLVCCAFGGYKIINFWNNCSGLNIMLHFVSCEQFVAKEIVFE